MYFIYYLYFLFARENNTTQIYSLNFLIFYISVVFYCCFLKIKIEKIEIMDYCNVVSFESLSNPISLGSKIFYYFFSNCLILYKIHKNILGTSNSKNRQQFTLNLVYKTKKRKLNLENRPLNFFLVILTRFKVKYGLIFGFNLLKHHYDFG